MRLNISEKVWTILVAAVCFCSLFAAEGFPQGDAPAAADLEQQAGICQSAASYVIADVRIVSAGLVTGPDQLKIEAGRSPIGAKYPFCRIRGVIEKETGFEIWLPVRKDWNGKYLAAGVGGDAGTLNFVDMGRGLKRGYAAASTDTGHLASDPNWMLGDPQRLTNFELLAHHHLATMSKAIIAKMYGQAAEKSYFIGCSGGGRQGLKEMQRYPGDYDGIISGAPGPDTPEMTARRMWELLLRDRNNGLMSAADWQLISKSAIAACDAADGVIDGVMENPRRCRFKISGLKCRQGLKDNCLSPEQIAFAEKFYAPLRDDKGRKLDDGLLPGVVVDSGHSRLAPATFGQAIRHQANWDGADFNLTRDLAAINDVMPELRADDADVRPFAAHGGKAIIYQGWMDPAVAAKMTIGYYQKVEQSLGGEAKAKQTIRLFLVPGMLHCGGGAGADAFGGSGREAPEPDPQHDLLAALDVWVKKGIPPEVVVASKMENGSVTATHPLCAYPKQAKYKGTGTASSADNYTCAGAERGP